MKDSGNFDRGGYGSNKHDPFEDVDQTYVAKAWAMFESSTDFLMWIHNAICFYICIVWLIPMILLLLISSIVDLRPVVKPNLHAIAIGSLAGLPLWMIISAYSRLSKSKWAIRIAKLEKKGMISAGFLILGGGFLLWILGWF